MTATEYLRVTGLHAFYGEAHVLHGMDFTIARGECVALLGRNGAGRTTTMRALMGLTRRTGSVMVNGVEAIGLQPHRIASLGVGFCPEDRGIYASLSAEECLTLSPQLGAHRLSLDELYRIFPNLLERRTIQASRLSGGEQQMLALARILRSGAPLLLLDEISEGLAPVIVQKLAEVVRTLKERSYTILLAEQNARFAARLADRMLLIERGRVLGVVARSEYQAKDAELKAFLSV